MSTTQLAIGGAFLVLIGSALVDFVTPEPPPIVVHDLHYEDGTIYQDRTVIDDGTGAGFFASWAARIEDVDTGEQVCAGEGSWTYSPGRSTNPIPLREWVGDADCTLSPGTYVPVAAWNWGYDQTSHRGDVFTIPEASE